MPARSCRHRYVDVIAVKEIEITSKDVERVGMGVNEPADVLKECPLVDGRELGIKVYIDQQDLYVPMVNHYCDDPPFSNDRYLGVTVQQIRMDAY